jgi:8-oxo-dGTP pyrophosphatase MutT (NUDIX family)
MLTVVYTGQKPPEKVSKSIFLAGPTPRSPTVKSWRPDFIKELENQGFDGVVFSPEWPPAGTTPTSSWNYKGQIEWEWDYRAMADVIAYWIPRELVDMPAFTTNVEFGLDFETNKIIYGHPDWAKKVDYLDACCRQKGIRVHREIDKQVAEILSRIGQGAERTGGERFVPLHIWKTDQFQDWYQSHKVKGNIIKDARVLWNYGLFCFALWVDMWIKSEDRRVTCDFVFSRTDISAVVAYHPAPDPMDTEVVLVKEFRSAVRNKDGYVHELPSGSGHGADPRAVAADELHEETGVLIDPSRFVSVGSRQLAATLTSHHAHVFKVELTDVEIAAFKVLETTGKPCGEENTAERCFVEVRTVKQIIAEGLVDWSMVGMVFSALR